MSGKARIRAAIGSGLFTSMALAILTMTGLEILEVVQVELSMRPVSIGRIAIYSGSTLLIMMLVAFRALSENHNRMGFVLLALVIMQGAFILVDGVEGMMWFNWVALGVGLLSMLLMFIPRHWDIAKFVCPFYVIHVDGPESGVDDIYGTK